MGYVLYSVSFAVLVVITVIYFTRNSWLPLLPDSASLPWPFNRIRYSRLVEEPQTPTTFEADAASGLHSSTFDLSANIESGDARGGLDERAKKEVQRVMKRQGLTFDEARRVVVMERFRREGVGADGRPRDPKFVSFD